PSAPIVSEPPAAAPGSNVCGAASVSVPVLTVWTFAELFVIPAASVRLLPPPILAAAAPETNERLLIEKSWPSVVARLPGEGVVVLKNTLVVAPGNCCVSMLLAALRWLSHRCGNG